MDVIGKLIQVLPEQRGESARGAWVRGGFVIETEEQFPRKIAFSVWGEDKVLVIKNIALNTSVKVVFTIESREYNERWYTDCRCNDVEVFSSAMPKSPYAQNPQGYQNAAMPSNPVIPTQTPTAPQSQPNTAQMPSTDAPIDYQQPPQELNQKSGTIDEMEPEKTEDDLPF